MSEIVQLYKDEQKTTKVYPKTIASEVYIDENTTVATQLEHIEIEKATKVEVDVERKRIDSLTKLGEGSTTGDAELIDARIGVNGETFTNLGESIRTQVGNLQKEIMKTISVDKISLIKDKYISYGSGNLSTLVGLYASDYITINGYSNIKIKNISNNSAKDAKGLAFYTQDKIYISGLQYNTNQTDFELEIPKKAYYIRFTTNSNSVNPIIYLTMNIINNINFLESIKNNQLLQNTKILYSADLNEIKDKYINSNGAIASATGYKYTSPIMFNKGDFISITAKGYSTNVSIISSSDESMTTIKPLIKSDSSELKNYNYIVEYDTYLVFSYSSLQDIFVLTKDNVAVKIIDYNNKKINQESSNLIDEMIRVFSKTICIGDSLTRGYNAEFPSGERNRDYSYPYALEKKYNTIFDNFGVSGITPNGWWEDYKDRDFSEYQCAIICLGTNGKLESELDNTAMVNIINKLKLDNSNIKIFILSLPPSALVDATVVNDKLKTIANNNNIPYIDIYTDSYCKPSMYRSDDGVHFKTLGYMFLALSIARKINEFMYANQSEYINIFYPNTLPPRLN